MGTYWDSRNHAEYYHVVMKWLSQLKGKRIMDVGCGDTPVVLFGDFEHRTALDIHDCRNAFPSTVLFIQENFMDFDTCGLRYDCITCLQMLEHMDTPILAIDKIMRNSDTCILSVPHMWKKDPKHVHNEITVKQFLAWVAKEPKKLEIVSNRIVGMF